MSVPPPAPSPRPCVSCPYRKDVPAGVWAAEEYAKLPEYDLSIAQQAVRGSKAAFYCHQADGRLCAGWVGCHGVETLGIRLLSFNVPDEVARAIVEYETDVPLFESGMAACVHGLSGIENPDVRAKALIDKLTAKQKRDHAAQ